MPANTGGGGSSGAAGTLNIKKGNSFIKLNATTSGSQMPPQWPWKPAAPGTEDMVRFLITDKAREELTRSLQARPPGVAAAPTGAAAGAAAGPPGGDAFLNPEECEEDFTGQTDYRQFDKRAHDKMRKLKHHFHQRHGVAAPDAESLTPPSGPMPTLDARPEFARKAVAKVGSLENIHWKSHGGAPGAPGAPAVVYRDRPLAADATSKRAKGALGATVPLFRHHPPQRGQPDGADQLSILHEKLEFQKRARAKIGSLENMHYKPGGGQVSVYPFTSPPKQEPK